MFNWSEFHFSEVTSYKTHTLAEEEKLFQNTELTNMLESTVVFRIFAQNHAMLIKIIYLLYSVEKISKSKIGK